MHTHGEKNVDPRKSNGVAPPRERSIRVLSAEESRRIRGGLAIEKRRPTGIINNI